MRVLLVILLVLFPYTPILANDKTHYDRVHLSADAKSEVLSDELVAVMSFQREGRKLAELADEVNTAIGQALKKSKQVSGIRVKTLNYRTNPVYKNQQITAWRVRQSMELKSNDTEKLSNLIGELQSSLALDSLQYMISDKQLNIAQEKLVADAIAAFTQRAEQITRHLGRKDYRLVSLNVNTGGAHVRPMHMASVARMETAAAAPVIEPGSQTVSVHVNGEIELLLK